VQIIDVLRDQRESDPKLSEPLFQVSESEVRWIWGRGGEELAALLIEAPDLLWITSPSLWSRDLSHSAPLPQASMATEGRMSAVCRDTGPGQDDDP
jgi:hypothetical protein